MVFLKLPLLREREREGNHSHCQPFVLKYKENKNHSKMMCRAACINIYVSINIDRNAPYTLLSTPNILKFPVIQASSH